MDNTFVHPNKSSTVQRKKNYGATQKSGPLIKRTKVFVYFFHFYLRFQENNFLNQDCRKAF
jgi:hypothetical protein